MNIRPSLLVQTGSRTIVPTIVAVSLFLLVVGHDAPGGGFVGGLLAGAALLVVFLAADPPSSRYFGYHPARFWASVLPCRSPLPHWDRSSVLLSSTPASSRSTSG